MLKLYEPGGEGPMWWERWPDYARGQPTGGILDRCRASRTCPKIVEHFGAAEIWALKFGPGLVGMDPRTDIPLPSNVRRYYIASTRHGGGRGGFTVTPGNVPNGPGNGITWGPCSFEANPMPFAETENALFTHFREWVMDDTPPPPSRYPTLKDGTLVAANRGSMGFAKLPAIVRSTAPDAPDGIVNPVKDYDWGPRLDYIDQSGIVDEQPPTVKGVFPTLVPRVDADGNELGGVPVVLNEAPLGTYLGWNVTSAGFFEGRTCSFAGGMIPFAKTEAERLRNGDPRPSLEERYVDHDGYVAAVRAAAAKAVEERFLLPGGCGIAHRGRRREQRSSVAGKNVDKDAF